MSGAQPKACQLLGCIGVVAEVSEEAAKKRHSQGWCQELIYDLDQLINRIRECREKKIGISLGYVGNVVNLWFEHVSLDLPRENNRHSSSFFFSLQGTFSQGKRSTRRSWFRSNFLS